MKNWIGKAAVGLAAVASLAIPASAAGVRVSVPFAFEAGNTQLPAGSYVIEKSALGASISIWSVDRNRSVMVNTMPAGNGNTPKAPALVFEKLGDSYRLAEVRLAGTQSVDVPRTPGQSLIANEQDKTVLVALAFR